MINEDEEITKLIMRQGFLRFGSAAVVDSDGKLVGMIGVEDIRQAIRSLGPRS
jgi:CBS domain-containing protein